MKSMLQKTAVAGLLLVAAAGVGAALGGQQKDTLGHQDTPLQANGKWHVHDRPAPAAPRD